MPKFPCQDAWIHFEAQNLALDNIHLSQDVKEQILGGVAKLDGNQFAPKRVCQGECARIHIQYSLADRRL